MTKILRHNVGGVDTTIAGCALTGVCPTADADYVKQITLSDGDVIEDGMMIVVTFANGNSAGNAPGTKIVYSSDQVNYYEDEQLTVPFTLAPEGCYKIEYAGTANVYTYTDYPVFQVGTVSGPVCDYRGHITSVDLWEAGDSVQCMLKEGKFLLLGGSGGDKVKPVDVVESGNMHAVTSNAVADVTSNHNVIFRGKCLNGNPATMYPILPIGNTKYLPGGGYTIEQVLANIAAGNFDDIYIGDYFIDSNNKVYRIAGLDTELNKGETPLTSHHAVIVTDFALTTMGWNRENTTVGGYQSSDVQAYCDGDGQAAIESVFGAAHVLTVSDVLSKTINATAPSLGYPVWQGVTSDWGWFSHKVRLMSEVEVYGARVWSGGYDIGTANEQFPLFRLMPQLATGLRYGYWLSGIVSATIACCVPDFGSARYYFTGVELGVRVRFLVG